jgi:DNA polymerase (family X)
MINSAFAALLSEMATLLELKQDNVFRIRAYQRAAHVIAGLASDVAAMPRQELLQISGIGQGIAGLAEEFAKTGRVKEHEALRKKFPAGLLALLQVPCLGPKRARLLFDKLKIDSPAKLKIAATAGRLRDLEGFGAKTEENILKGLSYADSGKRMLYWEARILADSLLEQLRGAQGVIDVQPAGSLRRGKETVGDLDLLCSSHRPKEVIARFTKLPAVVRVLAAGHTKASVILNSGTQCDLRVVEPSSYGAALQYFTGSKEHNVALRERALRMGYTINEYGLYRLSDRSQAKPLAGRTEEEIYRKLGLQYIPPELRENRGEIQAAEKKKLPRLIEEKDIKGCFHNHTTESDGSDDLEDMVAAAAKRGWEWYAVADHSPSLKIASGLEPERLRRKMEKVRAMNKKGGLRVLCSSEVDILVDGRMDYEDELLKKLDVVVGSIHSGFKQTEEQLTGRLLKAMENPHVDCIGHLTGRLLGKRDAYALNLDKVIDGAARTFPTLTPWRPAAAARRWP